MGDLDLVAAAEGRDVVEQPRRALLHVPLLPRLQLPRARAALRRRARARNTCLDTQRQKTPYCVSVRHALDTQTHARHPDTHAAKTKKPTHT